MNPVDHVSFIFYYPSIPMTQRPHTNSLVSLTVVVTINISVKPRQSPGTPPQVKKPVLLLPGELVCSAVPRRPRIRIWLWLLSCVVVFLFPSSSLFNLGDRVSFPLYFLCYSFFFQSAKNYDDGLVGRGVWLFHSMLTRPPSFLILPFRLIFQWHI